VLQCVAVCCSARQKKHTLGVAQGWHVCVAVCCSVLQCVAVCCNVLQWKTKEAHSDPSVLVPVAYMCGSVLQCVAVCCSVLQCVEVCCSVLQYVVVEDKKKHTLVHQCCIHVLQCVAVCCIELH